MIARALALGHQESCRGTHTTLLIVHPRILIRHPIMLLKTILGFLGVPGGYSAVEIEGFKGIRRFTNEASGYQAIQKEKPQVCLVRRMILCVREVSADQDVSRTKTLGFGLTGKLFDRLPEEGELHNNLTRRSAL